MDTTPSNRISIPPHQQPTDALPPPAQPPPSSSQQQQNPAAAIQTQQQRQQQQQQTSQLQHQQQQPRVIIKAADMPQDMQRKAISLAVTALDRFELERDMAHFMKREFDQRFQPSWHCIVGRHFGSFVTHDGSGFLYFYVDKTAVLLFRSGS